MTFLGTGTSSGVPVLTCTCEVCRSVDYRDKRLRSSVLIRSENTCVVIDTGPDFRQQMLRMGRVRIDAVLYTHEHKDHTAGLDDIRPYNYLRGKKEYIPLYARPHVLDQLRREFGYIFAENPYPGVPLITTHAIDNEPFPIGDLTIRPIEVRHHQLPVLGFRVGDITYITDANFISEQEKEKIKGSRVLVLNALQRTPHISHFTLAEAVALAQELQAETTYFTHISHKLGLHYEVEKELPANIRLAYDGLTVKG
ncbi:MAG: MBL fold metallo-hydrolase [Leadbetterella sp.]|nr:MBL fold metallo-hydrolase [Leadbetterella sp.]